MRKLCIYLAAFLLVAAASPPLARAVGTLAGTTISNQSYGDFSDNNGNAMPRVYSNTVTMTVSQVAGVLIDPPTITSAAKNGDVIYFLSQLFNTGNSGDTQTFSYALSGDWTPTSVRMFYDINNSHAWDAGDVLLTETSPGSKTFHTVNGAGTPVIITADDDYDVIIEVTVPAVGVAPNGTSGVVTVNTISDFDNTKTATGTYTTTILAAVISAVKTHTPTGSPTHLQPGETITYTTTLNNSGSIDGSAMTLNDVIPSSLTYVPGSLKINVNGAGFVAKTDGADSDGVKYDAGTKSVISPDGGAFTLPAGQTWAVQFQATVNAGVPSGTAITNQATLTYTSGTSTVTVYTNGDTFFVSTLPMIDLNTSTGPKTGDPGDLTVYPFNAVNNGNAADTIELTTTSSTGWEWVLWADENNDGIPGNDGDYILTDTDVDGKVDTGLLDQYGSKSLLAVATMPPGTGNGTIENLTINGYSANDNTVTDFLTFATTVRAPILLITKELVSVLAPGGGSSCTPTNTSTGAPCQIFPGSVLTYIVTARNNGNGNMTSLVLTDPIPHFTAYKAGTIQTGSTQATLTARTDDADGDGAEFNSGSNAVIIPDGTTINLGPSGTWVFQFEITVN